MFFAMGGVLEVLLAMIAMQTGGWRVWLILTALPLLIFLTLCHVCNTTPELRTQNSELKSLFNIILEDCNKFDA